MTHRRSHYVSRFLTKPWEFDDRRLHFFSFDKSCFATASSKSLFRTVDGYSANVEDAFRDIIENPLASLLARTSTARLELLKEKQDWPIYRSLVALILTQAVRYDDLNQQPSVARELPALLARGKNYLDGLAEAHSQRSSLYVVPIKRGCSPRPS